MEHMRKRQRVERHGIGFSEHRAAVREYGMDYISGPEESSNAFIGLQNAQAEMYADIKAQFIADEAKKFRRSWTQGMKDDLKWEVKREVMTEDAARAKEFAEVKKLLDREREKSVGLERELEETMGELVRERERRENIERELEGLKRGVVVEDEEEAEEGGEDEGEGEGEDGDEQRETRKEK